MAIITTEERPPAEERISHLEGAYGHLATKADVADARADARTAIAEAEARTTKLIAELRAQIAESQTRATQVAAADARTAIAEAGARVAQRIKESETHVAQHLAELRAEISRFHTNTRWLMAISGFIIVTIILIDRLLG